MSVRTRVISCLYPSFSKPSDATASTCFVSLAGDFAVDIVGRVLQAWQRVWEKP